MSRLVGFSSASLFPFPGRLTVVAVALLVRDAVFVTELPSVTASLRSRAGPLNWRVFDSYSYPAGKVTTARGQGKARTPGAVSATSVSDYILYR
jgi:hypothetical protein